MSHSLGNFVATLVDFIDKSKSALISLKKSSYTSFKVYVNNFTIPVGRNTDIDGIVSEEVAPSFVEKFEILTNSPVEKCDVSVDWGDGSTSHVKKGEQAFVFTIDNGRKSYNVIGLSHTYTNSGKFTVKIYGKDYFGVSHRLHTANIYSNTVTVQYDSSSLLCECFTSGLYLAPCVKNIDYFAYNSPRLLNVVFADYILSNIKSAVGTFENCVNLISFEKLPDLSKVLNMDFIKDCDRLEVVNKEHFPASLISGSNDDTIVLDKENYTNIFETKCSFDKIEFKNWSYGDRILVLFNNGYIYPTFTDESFCSLINNVTDSSEYTLGDSVSSDLALYEFIYFGDKVAVKMLSQTN